MVNTEFQSYASVHLQIKTDQISLVSSLTLKCRLIL